MNGDQIIDLVADVLVVLPIIGIISSVFLWHLFLSDAQRPRSWILQTLAVGATAATLVSVAVAILAGIRLSGQTLGTNGGVVLALTVLVLELIPLYFALSVARRYGIRLQKRIRLPRLDRSE